MRYLTAAIAIAAGLIVLAGSLYPLDVLVELRALLTGWAVSIAAMAVLVGVINLALVHLDKLRRREKNSLYGIVLVAALVGTFAIGVLGDAFGLGASFLTLAINSIIVPVEASLMAILAVTLVYASIRLLRRRVDLMSVLFLAVAIVFLIAVMPKPIDPMLSDQIQFPLLGLLNLFADGGARGLVIGIALGVLLTSLRVLFGIDRPYGGN